MSRAKKGDRVGVVLKASEGRVWLCGYGLYVGDEVPPTGTFMLDGMANPKLVLDDGSVWWGCQTWWGPENQIRERFAEYEVVGPSHADWPSNSTEEGGESNG